MTVAPDYELRPADPLDDLPALLSVHERAFRPLVEERFPWDPDTQRQVLSEVLAESQVVLVDGEVVGQLLVAEREDSIFLERIMLDPSVQGRGLGTALVRSLIELAAARRVPLTLSVWENNRARSLYERLGFRITERVEFRVKMRLDP